MIPTASWRRKRVVFTRLFALALAAASGCSEEPTADVDNSALELRRGAWTLCADEGQRCDFSGTQEVRYSSANGDYTRTFSQGVNCRARNFGAPQGTQGHCSIRRMMSPQAGSPAPAAGGRAVAGSGGDAHGAAGAAPAAGSGGTGDAHAGHMTAGSGGSGPHIDTNAIPTGSAGVNKPMLSNTSEQPASSDGTGAFRTVCDFSRMTFDDPIVFPGQPGASHLHAFFGNTAVDAFSTADSIAKTGNSTCRGGTINRSGYWVPALIDPAGKPVKPAQIEVYYKSGYYGVRPSDVRPMPAGLRMIAGSAKSSGPQRYAYWDCHDHYSGHPSSIPNCPAGDYVTMIIEFPQCWDGKNLDSPDHTSHMAYAQGGCPATHPIAIPAITFNVEYPQPSGGTAGYRLASDMYDSAQPGGYSAHGDWWNGWDPAIEQTFVEHCINPAVDCHSHLLGDGRQME